MGFRENIKRIRLERDMTQEQLAKLLDISRSAITQWESGWSEPKMGRIEDIAAVLGVKKAELIEDSYTSRSSSGFASVPLYGAVSGGIPIEMIEDMTMREAPARFLEDDPDCFLVKVKGNSENRKGIFDGDYALISPKHRDPNEGGLFFVAVNGDEATLKEVNVLENGVELVPDSYDPTYTRQIYDFNDPSTPSVEIRGKYVWHCAPF